jgi:hypothetical protein
MDPETLPLAGGESKQEWWRGGVALSLLRLSARYKWLHLCRVDFSLLSGLVLNFRR